jgi:hypothetical protein
MAYQRVTLADLRAQLSDLLKTAGNFWIQEERDAALNEAIEVWQLMTGEKVITVTQSITSTTVNLVSIITNHTNGTVLSVLRVESAAAVPLREMSLKEMDDGYYGWRSETASTTTQRPEYWAPAGLDQVMIYPRTGATSTYNIQAYADPTPLTATTDYIDIDESHLTKVLAYAQSLLAFKQGVGDGTDNVKALRELFLTAARERNRELLKSALYKNYMGQHEDKGEPAAPAAQQGARG